MKKMKRIGCSALAVAIFLASISSLSANAIFRITTCEPEGYTQLDDLGIMQKIIIDNGMSENATYTPYYKVTESGKTEFCMVCDYMFNYTELYIKNTEAFSTIYNKYKDALDFDHYDEYLGYPSESSTAPILSITMYDNMNADGNYSKDSEDFQSKRDLIILMYRELQEADALDTTYYSSVYYSSYAQLLEGTTDNSVYVTQIQDGETEALTAIAAKFDEGAVVEAEGSETELSCTYTISNIDSIKVSVQIANEIEQDYAKAKAGIFYLMAAESNNIYPDTVDLSIAQIYGDPDNDTQITPDDAYHTLCYYAKASVGADAAFTDNSDEAREAAAFAAADVNGDGVVNGDDAYLILRHYAAESVGGTPGWD